MGNSNYFDWAGFWSSHKDYFDSLDAKYKAQEKAEEKKYKGMTTREVMEARHKELMEQENVNCFSDFNTYRNKAIDKRDYLKNNNDYLYDNQRNLVNFIGAGMPVVSGSVAFNILNEKQNELIENNRIGLDNYAHINAMAQVSKLGRSYENMANIGGIVKELGEFFLEEPKTWEQAKTAFKSGWKDIKNNWQGLQIGREYPNIPTSLIMQDFDYKNNCWRIPQ